MPIIYVHGVNVRSRKPFEEEYRTYLRRYVAPVLSSTPESVLIEDAYWGDLGVKFAWYGDSRPASRLLGMGPQGAPDRPAVEQILMADLLSSRVNHWPAATAPAPASGGLLGGPAAPAPNAPALDLAQLTPPQLSDLLSGVASSAIDQPAERTVYQIAADETAFDPGIRLELSNETARDKQLQIVLRGLQRNVDKQRRLTGMGASDFISRIGDRAREALGRAGTFPAYTASVFAAEARKPLNDLVSVFIGDVFQYVVHRMEKPHLITDIFVNALLKAQQNSQQNGNEPIIVLSHSMGGQIVYDAVSYFLPKDPNLARVKIHFWCATASQVGFFEEGKFFLASKAENTRGHPVPFPAAHLGVWWNVWDPNDILSFTAREIFQSVDDESFDSGLSLLNAHGGYLQRPSFYRRFADKLKLAKQNGWRPS